MSLPTTESRDPAAIGLSKLADTDIMSVLLDKQVGAFEAVERAIPDLVAAAQVMKTTIETGGLIAYAGAGSSGLAALSDYLELPGTFGLSPDRLRMLYAGGATNLISLTGGAEDDLSAGEVDLEKAGIGTGDCLICVSASGSTPYTLGTLRAAKGRGAKVIALVSNPDTLLLNEADFPVLLETAAEIIAGSTRMGAATAQKAAMNLLSTLVALRLGHVVRGHMINLVADNEKLKSRAHRIVCDLARCTAYQAETALERAGGRVKIAVLLSIQNALTVEQAEIALAAVQGNLRDLLPE